MTTSQNQNQIRIASVQDGLVPPGEYGFQGWVKTHRRSKNVAFIELTDGSSVQGLQLVIDPDLSSYAAIASEISTGASLKVTGMLRESLARGQKFELDLRSIELVGGADPETYPLQKKGHTLEFLREHLHLRSRSNTLGAVFRIRSILSFAVHKFFQERGFIYVHTPIISTSDCEGAGEVFQVTTLRREDFVSTQGEELYKQDFFGELAGLTVSGQLQAEVFAQSHSACYTFGPTFRSENSNTSRHLAEFWMIEPEVSFCDLEGDIRLAEDFVRYLAKEVLDRCESDLAFLAQREWVDYDLLDLIRHVHDTKYAVMSYSEAIEVLIKSNKKFEFPVAWGSDLQAEHERFLTEEYVKKPVFVINYPEAIKAFYMRSNDDDPRTVAAMDLLVPRLGELIGGSQREERYDVLCRRMEAVGLSLERYQWYLDLRRYGSTPHAGFGLGFERLLMYFTGIQNIRDVIPYPRYPGHAVG
ncbi:MAG: asparagine--tRNA ligase [Bdellovibrionales bacterium]|nr:asparagine--tRNA ligase [Bdellovibrionales bacterium]